MFDTLVLDSRGMFMRNVSFLLFLLYTVSLQAQDDVDFGALFVESLENLERELLRNPGCQYRNEDGEITISSDNEEECDQIKSQAKRSFGKFKREIRHNFNDNLDLTFQMWCPSVFSSSPEGSSRPPSFQPGYVWDLDVGRTKYNISKEEFKCEIVDLKLIRDLGLGTFIEPDTTEILCCQARATVKTKDFNEFEINGLVRAGIQIARGESFKAGLEIRGERSFDSTSGENTGREFIGLSVNFNK